MLTRCKNPNSATFNADEITSGGTVAELPENRFQNGVENRL